MPSIDRYIDDNGAPIAPPNFGPLSDSDISEWNKLSRFTPGADPQGQQIPWWQSTVLYGITKAIDNTFPNDPRGAQGNTNPGSFAGTNGRTYVQPGALAQAPSTVGGLGHAVAGMNPLVLLALIAAGMWVYKAAR